MTARPVRVLCVVDDPDRPAVGPHLLADIPGFSWTATGGPAAWAAFRRDPPDAVLVDSRSPAEDGLDLIRRCRAADRFVPIIAVSGAAPAEVAEGLMRSGADDHLGRHGLTADALAGSVRAALRRADWLRARAAVEPPTADALLDRIEALFGLLAGVGVDALAAHLEAVIAESRRADRLDRVADAFDRACRRSGVAPETAGRVLHPFLLAVATHLADPPPAAP